MKFISHKIKKIPLLLILKGMRFMGMEIPPKATVSVLIHDKKNKILMLKLSYKDGYSLPGGSVKEGETFERAAMREFAEEVGGKITDLKYLGSFVGKKGNYSNLHVCFKAKIVKNKLNLMSGAYASSLLDAIVEADMNPQEVIEYAEGLHQQNQYMGVYYFLLYLFAALEMDIPYLYLQLPRSPEALQYYIGELIAVIKDCALDQEE